MGHLKDTNQSYFTHWRFAFQFGLVLVLVGLCVLVHAFIPSLFKTTGYDAIRAMYGVFNEEEE